MGFATRRLRQLREHVGHDGHKLRYRAGQQPAAPWSPSTGARRPQEKNSRPRIALHKRRQTVVPRTSKEPLPTSLSMRAIYGRRVLIPLRTLAQTLCSIAGIRIVIGQGSPVYRALARAAAINIILCCHYY